MNTDNITALVLTFNEEANLERVLEQITWLKRVVLLDSFSTDKTLEIASRFPNVCVHQRVFDTFASQCNYGLTFVATEWVLSIDSDYIISMELANEIQNLNPDMDSYEASFRYCVFGTPLRGALYPARKILYRKQAALYEQDGHAHRVRISGNAGRLIAKVDHDDRKSLSVWVRSQSRYAAAEAEKLEAGIGLDWKDQLRTWLFLAPVLTLGYCLLVKGLWRDGRPGFYYTLQRVFAELLLGLELLDRKLRMRP